MRTNALRAPVLCIGVLASHEGSLLQAILDACAEGRICARVCVVISNNSDSGALRRARDANVRTAHLSSATHPDPTALDRAISETLEQANVDLVVLVGYMKRLGPATLAQFKDRMINTHPSLLPKYGGSGFFGRRVHDAVLANGDTESGATVHWVAGDYDSGPIIAQVRVPVTDAETPETLETKVKAAERRLLIDTLRAFADRARTSSIAS
jgi:phosphoribosylglycinamide formyltransferase-1